MVGWWLDGGCLAVGWRLAWLASFGPQYTKRNTRILSSDPSCGRSGPTANVAWSPSDVQGSSTVAGGKKAANIYQESTKSHKNNTTTNNKNILYIDVSWGARCTDARLIAVSERVMGVLHKRGSITLGSKFPSNRALLRRIRPQNGTQICSKSCPLRGA